MGNGMRADYIIVGAGSAGCVLAARLSENPNVSVLLIEAGGADTNPSIQIPAGFVKTMVNPSLNWMFTTAAEDYLGGRQLKIPRGKVLGGTSSINGMLYVRGLASDYDGWAQRGNPGWSFDEVLPYFHKSEDFQPQDTVGDEGYHSTGGPMHIDQPRTYYPALDRIMDAAEECGYPKNNDYNGAEQFGFGYFQLNQKNGRRQSAYRAFVKPVEGRKNLTIMTGAQAQTLLFSSDDACHAIGVRVRRRGRSEDLYATHDIIMSAGAIQSPQLLELSGIGQSARLAALGIEVRCESKGVGENLTDHFLTRLTWELTQPISLNEKTRGIKLLGELATYLLHQRGSLSMPAGILGGFVKSDPVIDDPDIQLLVAHASFANPAKRIFDKFPGVSIGPNQSRPHSRGHVHITSANPMTAPEIAPRYLTAEHDRFVLVEGMKIARQIMAADCLKDLVKREVRPGPEISDDESLLAFARETGNTVYHPVSTCRMGPDKAAGDVVDAELRVHGMRGLRVVDASIMPQITSGNTHAPTVMIAEKAADMIKAAHRI